MKERSHGRSRKWLTHMTLTCMPTCLLTCLLHDCLTAYRTGYLTTYVPGYLGISKVIICLNAEDN